MNSSTSINPFTVDLRHAFRPKCRCESCTRIRIFAMKDGHILIAHIDQIDRLTRDAASPRFAGGGSSSLSVSGADGKTAAFKQKEAEDRRLRFIEGIVAAAGVLHISH